MSQFFNLQIWVPVVSVVSVLIISGLIVILVRHFKGKYRIRSNSTDFIMNTENTQEVFVSDPIPYSRRSLPAKESVWENDEKNYIKPNQYTQKQYRITSDTSEGLYENYLFEQSE